MEAVLTTLYSFTGAVIAAVYIPQIIAVSRDTHGCKSISLFTWLAWSVTSCITTAYASLVVKDLPFALVSLSHFLGCISVSLITIYKRRKYG